MSYELSIQREDDIFKISKKEWLDYLKSDSQFEEVDEISAELPNGENIQVPTPYAGLWKIERYEIPFIFSEEFGWITVKNPSDITIKKMISIANSLDAEVLGDEGEKYTENNYIVQNHKRHDKKSSKKWWEFWK